MLKCVLNVRDLALDTLVKLSCILKGTYFKKNFNQSEMKFIKEEVESFDFHFMPCIINEFYKTISNQFYGIARIYLKEKFYFADGRKKKVHEFNMDSELTNFMSFNAPDFNKFMDERAEVIFHTFGINQNNSLSERIIKKKGENCSKCYQLNRGDKCSIAPIKMFVLDKDGYVDAEYLSNPCDIRLKKTYNNMV
ncbi:hypothetical protein [Alishewanella sp. HL-SH06]|uniref:hypothetical protein n=1 Tax=Alishewanella sp. HL-SH06 TaxID=3461144 RepID=UPI004043129B